MPLEPDFRQRIATHVKPVVGGLEPFSFITNLNPTPDATLLFSFQFNGITGGGIHCRNTEAFCSPVTRTRDSVSLPAPEELEWKGAVQTTIHGFLLKPANFDQNKKYPLLVLIHGGPQGAWNDNWGYRWNPQIFANAGYVVFLPNQRGSTGYGQKFVNDVSADWGGKAFVDIKNGVAEV